MADDEASRLLLALQWAGRTGSGDPACPVCQRSVTDGHAPACRLIAVAGRPRRVWRHRKRGTTYVEVGEARLQTTGGGLRDQDAVVVYQAEADGALYVRALIEFTDGRFEPVG